jgi:urease accessory protein
MDVMVADAHRMRRHELPVITQSLVRTPDAPDVADWVRGLLDHADTASTRLAGPA